MEHELYNWKTMVKCIRGNFYELNYFSTLQLLTLRRDLGRIKNPNSPAIITSDVLALLQSISSQVTPSIISSAIRKVSTECLQLEAESERKPKLSPEPELEGTNEYDIISDIPSISVSHKTEKAKFKPSLTESQLTEDQREIMTNLVESLDCPKWIVLKAFEELCGKECDKYDYRRWCNDNMNRLMKEDESEEEGDFADEESCSDDDDDESSSSDSDNEEKKKEFNYSSGTVIII